jgi:hypothetical protein
VRLAKLACRAYDTNGISLSHLDVVMPPQELLQAVRRRPFSAFRLHVSDGTTYEIRHPELLMVAVASAVVGLPSANQPPPAVERYEIVNLRHIVRLEPLEMAAKPDPEGNGT